MTIDPRRFDMWPWRDFGHSQITHKQAALEALHAEVMASHVRLPGRSNPWPVSAWVPWAQCNAAEFAAAGVGVA